MGFFANCAWLKDLKTFLNTPLKSCKNEASVTTLGVVYHTNGTLRVFLPISVLCYIRETLLVNIPELFSHS